MITISSNINSQKYGQLLSATLPSVIKTKEENDRAISVVENLLAKEKTLSPEESNLLELIGKLIADFEEDFYQPRNALPHEVLAELMNAKGLIQKDLVGILGSKSRVSEAVSGKREISKTQAKSLADYFSISADLFL